MEKKNKWFKYINDYVSFLSLIDSTKQVWLLCQLNILPKYSSYNIPLSNMYMDGTFKVIKEPFTQLYSIHSFVKQNGEVKQVPLAFVLMSGKRKHDYRRVLTAV